MEFFENGFKFLLAIGLIQIVPSLFLELKKIILQIYLMCFYLFNLCSASLLLWLLFWLSYMRVYCLISRQDFVVIFLLFYSSIPQHSENILYTILLLQSLLRLALLPGISFILVNIYIGLKRMYILWCLDAVFYVCQLCQFY